MKLRKMLPLISLGVVFLIAAIWAGSREPYKLEDFVAFIEISLLAFMCFFTRAISENEPDPGQKWVQPLASVMWKLFLLLGSLVMLGKGFDLYKAHMMAKGLLFFTPGLLTAFYFFYIFDKTPAQFEIRENAYKPLQGGLLFAVLKSANALLLAFIGVYLIKAGLWLIADIAFIASLIQLVLIFRPVDKTLKDGNAAVKPAELVLTSAQKYMSLAMIAASLLLFYMAFMSLRNYDFHSAFVYFIVAAFLFGAAPGDKGFKPEGGAGDRLNLFDAAFMVFIFIAGMILFNWQFYDIPPGIHGDERNTVHLAKAMASGTKYGLYFPNEELSAPSLQVFLITLLAKMTGGVDLFTSRLFSMLSSALMLVFTYLLFKNLFNRTVGVISSILAACFFLTLLYSRIAIMWMPNPLLAAASLYLFYHALKKGNMAFFVGSGALVGLNLYFYNAARLLPFFFVMFTALVLFDAENRKKVLSGWRGLVLLAVAGIIIYLPMLDYAAQHYATYAQRVSKVALINHMPPSMEDMRNLSENIIRNIQMFFTLSANGYCHNLPQKPFFDMMTGYWAIVGAGFLAFTWRKPASLFAIAFLCAGLAGGFLSRLGPEDPFPSRMVMGIPPLMLFIALGMERVMAKLNSLWPRIFKWIAPLVFAYAMAHFIFYNFNNFFVMYKNDPHTQVYYRQADLMLGKEMMKHYKDTIFHPSVFFIDNYYCGTVKEISGANLDKCRKTEDVSRLQLYQLFNNDNKNVSVVGEGIYYKSLPRFKEYFPDMEMKYIWDHNFWQFDKTSKLKYCYEWKYPDAVIDLNMLYSWFYVFDPKVPFVAMAFANIPYKDIDALTTLDIVKSKNGAPSGAVRSVSPEVVFDGTFDRAVFSGLIDIPEYKNYEFKVENGAGEVYLNGAIARGPQMLYVGLHRIKVVMKKTAEVRAALKWKYDGLQGFIDIPRGFLLNSDKIYGLNAEYRTTDYKKVLYKSLEPDIQQRMYWPAPRAAYPRLGTDYESGDMIQWTGYIDIPRDGKYDFKFDTGYDGKVTLEGRVVYVTDGKKETITTVSLTKGKKRLIINAYYHYTDKYWNDTAVMRFMYRPEGKTMFGPVTYDMLSPGF